MSEGEIENILIHPEHPIGDDQIEKKNIEDVYPVENFIEWKTADELQWGRTLLVNDSLHIRWKTSRWSLVYHSKSSHVWLQYSVRLQMLIIIQVGWKTAASSTSRGCDVYKLIFRLVIIGCATCSTHTTRQSTSIFLFCLFLFSVDLSRDLDVW